MAAALPTSAQPAVEAPKSAAPVELPPVLIRLESSADGAYRFHINPKSEEYRNIVEGVTAFGRASVPASLHIELISRAIGLATNAKFDSPLALEHLQTRSEFQGVTSLELKQDGAWWSVKILAGETVAAGGYVQQQPAYVALQDDFERYERLLPSEHVSALFDEPLAQSIRGGVMYRLLSGSVSHPSWYQGVSAVATLGPRTAARIVRPRQSAPTSVAKESQTELALLESVLQVVYLHANCLQDGAGDVAYNLSSVQRLQVAPHLQGASLSGEQSWDMLAVSSDTGRGVSYDVFVYNAQTGKLSLVLLGVRLGGGERLEAPIKPAPAPVSQPLASSAPVPAAAPVKTEVPAPARAPEPPAEKAAPATPAPPAGKDAKTSIFEDICGLLSTLADIPANKIPRDASFDDMGVDSLMVIEVISELQSLFKVEMPIDELQELTDLNSLVNYLDSKGAVGSSYVEGAASSSSTGSDSDTDVSTPTMSTAPSTPPEPRDLETCKQQQNIPSLSVEKGVLDLGSHGVQDAFSRVRQDFERYAAQSGAKGYWSKVYPDQNEVVTGYVCDAYRKLGVDLSKIPAGQPVPELSKALPKHKHLLAQLRNLLADSGLLELSGLGDVQQLVRTFKPVNPTPTDALYEQLLPKYPDFIPDNKCLQVTGPLLAECLTGEKDPLRLLFGDAKNKEILADFYAKSPMMDTTCRMMAEFVSSLPAVAQGKGPLRILEVGAGTGGTTRYLISYLKRLGVQFEYTFTDISQSLVNMAKRTFKDETNMHFRSFNADTAPPADFVDHFHLVLSTNCIHATSSIERTTANILPVIRNDGALCVSEFTRNLYWFDLVFGLLEGWWLMDDGRTHAMAPESFWDSSLRAAGYKNVSWSTGESEEADTVRLICGFKNAGPIDGAVAGISKPHGKISKRAGIPVEELVFKSVDGLDLSVDVYFPKQADPAGKKRAVALLMHGGGHFLFGRKDVPMKHIRMLLERGFLPVSTDYRLVPETTLFEGPMTDCCDALQWCRETLPTLALSGPRVEVNAATILSIGWSSGGQLAMSLGYTAPQRGVKPPEAVFGLYPPTDFESEHWHKPCYPLAAEEEPQEITDILAGVQERPILEYAPFSDKKTMALSLTLKDPRAKIILHTCWNSQTLPILVNGLPLRSSVSNPDAEEHMYPPAATAEQVHEINTFGHIKDGTYRTPTFIVHGNGDDWLPHSMSERTIQELKDRGIPAGLAIPEKCSHAFDLFPVGDPLSTGWTAIEQGYDFICGLLKN